MSSKRIGAAAAIAALIFGACSGSATPVPTPTTAPTAATAAPSAAPSAAPTSPSPASSATSGTPALAGKVFCISWPGEIGVLDQMYDNIRAASVQSGNGLGVTRVDGNFDASKQLADTAQFVASGDCAAIGTITTITSQTASAWQKTADDAAAKGIKYFNFSADWVNDATQNFGNPHYPAGYVVGQSAGTWYKANGGTGSVGIITAPRSPGLMMRVQGFQDGFKAAAGSSPQFYEAADDAGDVTTTAAAGASLLQAHSDMNVMFGWGGDTAGGLIQAANEAGKTSSNFFVGADDVSDALVATFANGTNGVLQAGTQFDFALAGVSWERTVEWSLLGATGIPPFGYVGPVLITKTNAADLVSANVHPLDPKNAHYYSDLMLYFPNAVKTGDPFPAASGGSVWTGASTVPQAGVTP